MEWIRDELKQQWDLQGVDAHVYEGDGGRFVAYHEGVRLGAFLVLSVAKEAVERAEQALISGMSLKCSSEYTQTGGTKMVTWGKSEYADLVERADDYEREQRLQRLSDSQPLPLWAALRYALAALLLTLGLWALIAWGLVAAYRGIRSLWG